jgi:hypothetical protein
VLCYHSKEGNHGGEQEGEKEGKKKEEREANVQISYHRMTKKVPLTSDDGFLGDFGLTSTSSFLFGAKMGMLS